MSLTPITPEKLCSIVRGRRNQVLGSKAEEMVHEQLFRLGYDTERLATPKAMRRIRGKQVQVHTRKVLADIVGVECATGRAVLIEVKRVEEPRLPWSNLEDHQVENLDRWHVSGALCFVAFVHGLHAKLLRWRCLNGAGNPVFGPRIAIPFDHPSLITLC